MATVQYRSVGVYGKEKTPARAAEGLSPAKMGIVGWTEKGPSDYPVQVASVEEFTRIFGGISLRGVVPLEMRAFFGSGGEKAYVSRVVPADALSASVSVDPTPGPAKWTFTARGAGTWGNDLKILIQGNRNHLNRVTNQWDKFDLKILEPSDADPTIDEASEVYEAIQFVDSAQSDYLANAFNDPRTKSFLISLTTGAAGTPSGLLSVTVPEEAIGTGGGTPLARRFTATLANVPVLDNTLVIKAISKEVANKVLTPTSGSINGSNTDFAFQISLADLPVIEGSLLGFYQRVEVENELLSPSAGDIDGSNDTFSFDAGSIANPVHREIATFALKYAATAGSSPETLDTIGGTAATYDLSSTPLTDTPVHPGTLSITVNVNGVGLATITDNGAGVLSGSAGSLPLGGTIDYASGAMTGITASLAANSDIIATYYMSNVITKRAQVNLAFAGGITGTPVVGETVTVGGASGTVARVGTDNVDVNVTTGTFATGAATFVTSSASGTVTLVTNNNMGQDVALTGDGSGSISLVDSETTPVTSGEMTFTATVAPIAGTALYLDYVALGLIYSDIDGTLSGDVTADGVANFDTGIITLSTTNPALSGSTFEFSYQQGQFVRDNGIGRLIGDVDASGTNTVDYDLGTIDVTFAVAPASSTPITAAYVKLAEAIQLQLSGGTNGSSVSRNDISNPTLAATKKGIYALDSVEEPLNIIVPDFEGSEFVQADIVDWVDARQDRFAILGFQNGTTVDEALQYVLVTQAFDSKNAAIYYPNVYFINDLTNRPELIPCTGFVAGIYAKTARNKNVGKSPGGIVDGLLDADGTVGPEFTLSQEDRDRLYPARINPLNNQAATGFVVWGARTLSKDLRWRYINARLLHNFLMYRIKLLLQWTILENNGPNLWSKITTALEGYLSSLYTQGYFAGDTKAQAYFVKCDARNNSQTTIDQGKVLIDVGFSPNKPAEFVVFSLQQPAGQTSTGL